MSSLLRRTPRLLVKWKKEIHLLRRTDILVSIYIWHFLAITQLLFIQDRRQLAYAIYMIARILIVAVMSANTLVIAL